MTTNRIHSLSSATVFLSFLMGEYISSAIRFSSTTGKCGSSGNLLRHCHRASFLFCFHVYRKFCEPCLVCFPLARMKIGDVRDLWTPNLLREVREGARGQTLPHLPEDDPDCCQVLQIVSTPLETQRVSIEQKISIVHMLFEENVAQMISSPQYAGR